MFNKKTSVAIAIVLTSFLTISPSSYAQNLKSRLRERVQAVKESIQSEWSIGQSDANPNQTKTGPSSQKQTKNEIPRPKTINELAEILGCTPEQATKILKSFPDEVTTAKINGIDINLEDVREAASQVKEIAHFQKVDLGLSVLWASCNIGASSPEGYGNYLAWGAVNPDPRGTYSWDTYKYYDWNQGRTKYTKSDNKTRLEPTDDVAQVRYGNGWRMPTKEEFQELKDKCSWSWTKRNGVNGYEVTGPNGNSIFLPAAGYKGSHSTLQEGSYGAYWSSDIKHVVNRLEGIDVIDYQCGTFLCFFSGGSVSVSSGDRCNGQMVRAVCVKE